MTDYEQLLGSIKALEKLEAQIHELNRHKTLIMRRATACGLNRMVLRDIIRMRRSKMMPDHRVPSLYESLLDRRNEDG